MNLETFEKLYNKGKNDILAHINLEISNIKQTVFDKEVLEFNYGKITSMICKLKEIESKYGNINASIYENYDSTVELVLYIPRLETDEELNKRRNNEIKLEYDRLLTAYFEKHKEESTLEFVYGEKLDNR